MNVPMTLPMFANTTTSNTFVSLFVHQPFAVFKSSFNASKSFTLGLRIIASVSPANHPAAKSGFKELIGAARNAVRIDNG